MKAILVINTQNDFVEAYPEGQAITEIIGDYLLDNANSNTDVFCVQDTHHEALPEYKFPYPVIGSFGHEIAPEVSVSLYDTRRIYNGIHYVMKTKHCAVEAINLMKASNFEEVTVMGFGKVDILLTLHALKEAFPQMKIKVLSRGITFDLPIEKLENEGWELIR